MLPLDFLATILATSEHLNLILPIAVGLLGLIVNAVWTVSNLRVENRLISRIEGLKEYMQKNYAGLPECGLRHEAIKQEFHELGRRLEVIGG